MSYTKEINRNNPTCFLFAIDQSGSMDEQMAGGRIKSEFVADVLNQTIAETIVRCTKADGVRDYFEIGVFGYGGDRVGSAFGGALSGRTLLPISEIENNPLRIDEREQDVDTGDGVLEVQLVKFPVWIDPQHDGGTPMREAMATVGEMVAKWCDEHPSSYPPTVVLRIDPDREFHQLPVEDVVTGIDVLFALVDPQRVALDLGDGKQGTARQRAAEGRADVVSAVTDDADIEVIADPVRLGAAHDGFGDRPVEHIGDELRLDAAAGHRLVHRAGLIDHEQEAGRVLPVDFLGVRHLQRS